MRRFFKRLFLENFFLKVGSFVLAIILWFTVQIIGKIEQKVDLKVETNVFQNLPEDGVVRYFKKPKDETDVVSVRMKGIPSAMSKIANQANLSIEIPGDFSDWGKEVVFELTSKNIQNVPFGVEILSINPSTISVMLDYYITKEVPVEINYGGQLPPGYKLSDMQVSPEQVTVMGPRSIVETLSSLMTRYFNINTLSVTYSQTEYRVPNTPLIFTNSSANYVTTDPNNIELIFTIVEILETRKFDNLVMEIKRLEGTETTEEIKPERVSVVIEGPRTIMTSINNSSFRIILDVQELPPDKWRNVTPKVEFMKDYASRLKVVEFQPATIAVKVMKKKSNSNS